MDTSELDKQEKAFLTALLEATRSDPGVQVSMYDIGRQIGLEREGASRTAEELMGWGLVEIRTLSGGIGLTPEGEQSGPGLGAAAGSGGSGGIPWHQAETIDSQDARWLSEQIRSLELPAGKANVTEQLMAENQADIRTALAQLASPRPKSSILKECLASMRKTFKECSATGLMSRAGGLLES